MARAARTLIAPRLLTKQQAAEYCGMCVATFAALCPVAPLVMQRLADGRSNKRLERYDVRLLDDWLDGFGRPGGRSADAGDIWLSRFGS